MSAKQYQRPVCFSAELGRLACLPPTEKAKGQKKYLPFRPLSAGNVTV